MLYPITTFFRIRICGKNGNALKDDGQKIIFRGSEVNYASFKSYDSFMAFDTIRQNLIDRKVIAGCELQITAQRRRYQDIDGNTKESYVIVSFEVLSRPEFENEDEHVEKQNEDKEEKGRKQTQDLSPLSDLKDSEIRDNRDKQCPETEEKYEGKCTKSFTRPFTVDDLEAFFK